MIDETASGLAASVEIRSPYITRLRCNLWPPIRQKTPDFVFGVRVADGRWIWNPQIELEASVALTPERGGPFRDACGLRQ
jgi:hypothetical protein